MALICDTSGIYALYDMSDSQHAAVAAVVESEPGALYLPVILLAEIDYLLHERLGADAALEFVEAVEQGDFTLVPLLEPDVKRCRELVAQYRDLHIGLADCSIVAAAERLQVYRLLTLDHRHFRAVTPRNYSHFSLLPADATGPD
jgi:predicted nucleic acid-binding protein